MNILSKRLKMSIATAAILAMCTVAGFARDTTETIDAQAFGTSTQMGKNFKSGLSFTSIPLPQTGKFWSSHSKRARTTAWPTHLKR